MKRQRRRYLPALLSALLITQLIPASSEVDSMHIVQSNLHAPKIENGHPSEASDSISIESETIYLTDTMEEYAVIRGINSDGDIIWENQTPCSMRADLSSFSDIGIYNGRYYYSYSGVVHTLNLEDGSEEWECKWGGAGISFVFDEDYTLYITGYYGPDLAVIDSEGNLLKVIDSFDKSYFWPHGINYDADNLYIHYENSMGQEYSEHYMCQINKTDYTFQFLPEDQAIAIEEKLFKKNEQDNSLSATAASVSIENRLQSVYPIIQTYANQEPLIRGEDIKEISCVIKDSNDFWSKMRIFSIFNANNNTAFTYTTEEIKNIAFSMFHGFDGQLPAYPEYFNTGGPATLEGDSIRFMPSSPEEQATDLVSYIENEDSSVDAIYLQTWNPSGSMNAYEGNNYFMIVHMVPNPSFSESEPLYYTIESIKYDRELAEDAGQNENGPTMFLGAYTLNISQEELENGNRGSNADVMKLYMDEYGNLIRYQGLLLGTIGTTRYNIISGYNVDGNTLSCDYLTELSYYNTIISSQPGTVTFVYEDGVLKEGDNTWYPYNYAGTTEAGSPQSAGANNGENGESAAASDASSPYIIPDSDSRYLTADDLRKLDSNQLRLARNEIYARKGRRFKDAQLQAYFDSQSWYNGTIAPDAFNDSYLNDYELKNAYFILEFEKG